MNPKLLPTILMIIDFGAATSIFLLADLEARCLLDCCWSVNLERDLLRGNYGV